MSHWRRGLCRRWLDRGQTPPLLFMIVSGVHEIWLLKKSDSPTLSCHQCEDTCFLFSRLPYCWGLPDLATCTVRKLWPITLFSEQQTSDYFGKTIWHFWKVNMALLSIPGISKSKMNTCFQAFSTKMFVWLLFIALYILAPWKKTSE